MGWCSATEIFDAVATYVLKYIKDDQIKEDILTVLVIALENKNWDCQADSYYYNNPIVKKAMQR